MHKAYCHQSVPTEDCGLHSTTPKSGKGTESRTWKKQRSWQRKKAGLKEGKKAGPKAMRKESKSLQPCFSLDFPLTTPSENWGGNSHRFLETAFALRSRSLLRSLRSLRNFGATIPFAKRLTVSFSYFICTLIRVFV